MIGKGIIMKPLKIMNMLLSKKSIKLIDTSMLSRNDEVFNRPSNSNSTESHLVTSEVTVNCSNVC